MRARIVAATVMGLVVLSMSTTAWGKGGGFAGGSISGPNLPSGGITIGGSGPAAEDLSRLGLFEGVKDRPPSAVGISKAELGPRYTLTYRMTDLPYGPLRQVLYPYAKGGVWTYTPPGQQLAPGEFISGGWWVASSSMLEVLVKYGLPARPPAAAPANPAGPGGVAIATQPLHSTAAWPWVAGAMLTLVLVFGLVVRRRAHSATQLG
jgi:hypothetical protein